MKQIILMLVISGISFNVKSQILKTWDGGGGDNRWNNSANWRPNGVPRFDSVVLDNRYVRSSYQVVFPDVALRFAMKDLVMNAETENSWQIELALPATNFADTAVRIGTLNMYDGTIFRNSGRSLGHTQLYVSGDFNLVQGAEYIHNSESTHDFSRANLEDGVIRFDVPYDSYRVDLTCPTAIKKIIFDGSANGTNVGYSTNNPTPRFETLIITESAGFSTYNRSLSVVNLVVDGMLNLATDGIAMDVRFDAGEAPWAENHTATFSGSGDIRLPYSRGIHFHSPGPGNTLLLQRDLVLNDPSLHTFNIRSGATFDPGNHVISGDGTFTLKDNAKFVINSPDGIWFFAPYGHIQTEFQELSRLAIYEFKGSGVQHTGDGIPGTISQLIINKPSGNLLLTCPTTVKNNLKLLRGKLITTASNLLTYEGDNNFGSPENRYNDHFGWEQSFVDGPMAIVFPGAAYIRVFPVGKGNVFAPFIMLKKNVGSATYTGEYFNTIVPAVTAVQPPLHHISRIEHWTISSNATSTATNPADDANLWLTWRPTSRIGTSHADRLSLRIGRFENSDFRLRWEMQNTSGPLASPSGFLYDYTIFLPTLVTDFSPGIFTLASTTAANPMTPIDIFPVVKTTQPAFESNAILYPNPVTSVLQVNVTASAIEIINPAGQLVKKQIVRAGNKIIVDMSGLPGGTYFLRVFNNGEAVTYPFVKQ